MELKIDHITVCGSNLEAMRAAFASVGLKTTYGGLHDNGVTHMDLLAFEDGSYLELIAPVRSLAGAGGMMSGWAKLMEGAAGAGAWAVRCSNVHAEAERLRGLGIDVRGPEVGSRKRPDRVSLQWETALLGPGPAGGVLPFVIQDKTARSLRVPNADSESRLLGVATVVIGVRDLKSSTEIFQRAFGWDEPKTEVHPDFGAQLSHFSATPVMLAIPLHADSWLGRRIERFGECPAAFLLEASDRSNVEGGVLVEDTTWFGRKITWFDARRLHHTRLGIIE